MADVKKGQKVFRSTIISVILVFVIVIAINIISANLFFRVDITQEHLFTLSDGTKKIVNRIDSPVTIKYYFTKNLKSLPLTYKNYGKKIEELLEEYRNLKPDQITLEVYNPEPDSDEEEWAQKYGLSGIDLGNGEKLIMGVVITQEDRELNIPFMDPRREQFLEYDITQLFMELTQKKDKIVGIMSTLPVMGGAPSRLQQMQGQRGSLPKWVFIQELEKTFKLKKVSPTADEIDPDISILLVIHPKNVTKITEYAIDQFVMRGGELIVMVDPNARVDQEGAMAAQMGQMPQTSSDLKDLFKHWGIDYQADKILGDKDHATRVNAGKGIGTLSYSMWHSLTRNSFDPNLVATKNLEDMLLVEPGGFTMDKDSPLKLQPVITSSTNSGLVNAYMTRFSDPLTINKQVKPDGKKYILAGILTGKLTSAFDKRPEKPKKDEKADKNKKPEPEKHYPPYISQTKGSCKIFIVTDVDFIADQFAVQQFNLLGQVISQPRNDNLNFMENMVEFLGGANDMMAIRSRGRFTRPFTRFLKLQQKAQSKYQAAENSLTTKLKEVQDKLSQLKVQDDTKEIVLTKDQIEKIKQFREEEKKTKSELRKIRKLLRQDIEAEKTTFTLVNLLAIPIILVIFGLILYYKRFHRKE